MHFKYTISILVSIFTLMSIIVMYDKNMSLSALEIPEVQTNDESSEDSSSTSANISQPKNVEEFALKATLDEQDSLLDNFRMYDVEGFGLNVSPNSTLCPTNNCEFELEDGKLSSMQSGKYLFQGTLKVGVEEEEGTRSNVMSMSSSLNTKETLEKEDTTTEFLTGDFKLGEPITVMFSPEISYKVNNGTLTIEDGEATLILQGQKD